MPLFYCSFEVDRKDYLHLTNQETEARAVFWLKSDRRTLYRPHWPVGYWRADCFSYNCAVHCHIPGTQHTVPYHRSSSIIDTRSRGPQTFSIYSTHIASVTLMMPLSQMKQVCFLSEVQITKNSISVSTWQPFKKLYIRS